MPTHAELTGIAITALAALACGIGFTRLKQPALVGYIIAGLLLGPSALGLVENREYISLLAELGVLLLLFLVGMELNIRDFRSVWRIASLATGMQILVSVLIMLALSRLFAWPLGLAVLLGFMFAVSSTAVAIKMLEDVGELDTRVGRLTVGVLIAQDLAVVPMMLIINAMAVGQFSFDGLSEIVLSLGILGGVILFLSRNTQFRLPFAGLVTNDRNLTPLAGLTFCFAFAALSGLIGLSPAYGAFLAGLIIGNSADRAIMMRRVYPIQSILIMVFFLSIGLLIDLRFIWENIGVVLLLLLLVTVCKTALNVVIFRVLREPWPRAMLSGVMIGQIGEFSFLLAATGLATGLINTEEYPLVVAVTVLSLAVSPVWLESARRLERIMLHSVTSGREILRLLYGAEAGLLMDISGRSAQTLMRWAHQLGSRVNHLRTHAGRQQDPEPATGPEATDAVTSLRLATEADPPAPEARLGRVLRSGTRRRTGADPTEPDQAAPDQAEPSASRPSVPRRNKRPRGSARAGPRNRA